MYLVSISKYGDNVNLCFLKITRKWLLIPFRYVYYPMLFLLKGFDENMLNFLNGVIMFVENFVLSILLTYFACSTIFHIDILDLLIISLIITIPLAFLNALYIPEKLMNRKCVKGLCITFKVGNGDVFEGFCTSINLILRSPYAEKHCVLIIDFLTSNFFEKLCKKVLTNYMINIDEVLHIVNTLRRIYEEVKNPETTIKILKELYCR